MPSPIGHALAGLIVHVATARDRSERIDFGRALTAVAAATLPDLDLVLRLVDGRNHHQGLTHSLLAALVAGILTGAVCRSLGHVRARSWGGLVLLAWGSHLLLDFLGRDTSLPVGIPLLWPYDLRFHCPWSLFLDVGRTLKWATVRHNAIALVWEIALLLPILALTHRWCARRTA